MQGAQTDWPMLRRLGQPAQPIDEARAFSLGVLQGFEYPPVKMSGHASVTGTTQVEGRPVSYTASSWIGQVYQSASSEKSGDQDNQPFARRAFFNIENALNRIQAIRTTPKGPIHPRWERQQPLPPHDCGSLCKSPNSRIIPISLSRHHKRGQMRPSSLRNT